MDFTQQDNGNGVQQREELLSRENEIHTKTTGIPKSAQIINNSSLGYADRKQEIARLNQEALASTQQSLLALGQTEVLGQAISEALKGQGEALDRIQQNLDHVHADLDAAKAALSQLASPLGFLGASGAQYASNFEKNFGVTGDWSGPMLKQRDLVPVFRERFFVLVRDQLYYFKDVKHMKSPRGIYNLRDASVQRCDRDSTSLTISNEERQRGTRSNSGYSVQSNPKSVVSTTSSSTSTTLGSIDHDDPTVDPKEFQLRIKLIHPSPKSITLRCFSRREYLGWAVILERAVNAKGFMEAANNTAVTCADSTGHVLKKVQSNVAHTTTVAGNPFADERDIDATLDSNLDLMSQMLNRIGNMADHQSFAIDEQNEKLERIEITVRDAQDRTAKLNTKGRRILGKPIT